MEVDLRKEYQPHRESEEEKLSVAVTPDHPVKLFQEWYGEAVRSSRINNLYDEEGRKEEVELYEPYAMVLSTVTSDYRPRSRVMLLREFNDTGLVFYTNYLSDKGKELGDCPYAAANFFWPAIDRQIRIEGKIKKTSSEHSKRYFDSRPSGSRIAAMVSKQSQTLINRETLIREVKHYSTPPSCPEYWGGYLLIPDYFEFWLGRRNRLHERLAYRLISQKKEKASIFPPRLSSETWEKYLLYP